MKNDGGGSFDVLRFDGKCVRLEDIYGHVYEGVCVHDSADYCLHEFGVDEEALQFMHFLVYKSQIREIVSLEERTGPYGRYSAPFGELEELTVEDGKLFLEDALFDEEPEQVMRLLNCLGAALSPVNGREVKDRAEILALLRRLAAEGEDEAVRAKARLLAEREEQSRAGNR